MSLERTGRIELDFQGTVRHQAQAQMLWRCFGDALEREKKASHMTKSDAYNKKTTSKVSNRRLEA